MGVRLSLLGPTLPIALVALVAILSSAQDGAGSLSKKPYVRTGNEANLSGTIKLNGKRAKPRRIDMAADVVCYQVNPEPKTEDVVGNSGKLANVFVYVSSSTLDSYSFALPAEPAVLQHKGCRYEPHVLGLRVGQPVTILNKDPTYHNTHPSSNNNPDWNQTQSPGSPQLKTSFLQPDFVRFKDDQHPWQQAFAGVFAHPFFAISNESGNYRIEGIPPGRYTVVVKHETLGEKTVEVTLVPGESKDIDFSFDSIDR